MNGINHNAGWLITSLSRDGVYTAVLRMTAGTVVNCGATQPMETAFSKSGRTNSSEAPSRA
jgi:hypothetical protein